MDDHAYSPRIWRSQERAGWMFHLLLGSNQDVREVTDVEVIAPDERRWVGDVGTVAALEAILRTYRETGECLGGRYVWVPNFVLIEDPSIETAFDVLADLADTGEIEECLQEVDGLSTRVI